MSQDFSGQILNEAFMQGRDLSDAIFTDSKLVGADLSYADLRGADLTNADLSYAILTGAKLDDAVLENTILEGASVESTILQDDFQEDFVARRKPSPLYVAKRLSIIEERAREAISKKTGLRLETVSFAPDILRSYLRVQLQITEKETSAGLYFLLPERGEIRLLQAETRGGKVMFLIAQLEVEYENKKVRKVLRVKKFSNLKTAYQYYRKVEESR
jgi:hypothetical protein